MGKTIYLYGKYTLKELEKLSPLTRYTIKNWLDKGYSVDEVITGKVKKTCIICGKDFETSNIKALCCCKTCIYRRKKGRGPYKPEFMELKSFKCDVCGKEFQSYWPTARLCSDKCRKAAARLERRSRFNQVRKEGRFDPSVTLENVFNKFGGKCCFCEKPLHFSDNPTAEDYPTIDHIKPLSKGGSHKWDNVQLLCRHCNNVKGAKYEERKEQGGTAAGACNGY